LCNEGKSVIRGITRRKSGQEGWRQCPHVRRNRVSSSGGSSSSSSSSMMMMMMINENAHPRRDIIVMMIIIIAMRVVAVVVVIVVVVVVVVVVVMVVVVSDVPAHRVEVRDITLHSRITLLLFLSSLLFVLLHHSLL